MTNSISLAQVFASCTTEDLEDYIASNPHALFGILHGKLPVHRRGLHDFTNKLSDLLQVIGSLNGAPFNIGLRLPGCIALDEDPRNGADGQKLEDALGIELPETLTSISGRGDGGNTRIYYVGEGARFFRKNLKDHPGFDLLDFRRSYMVAPPSVHPETYERYRWADESAQIVAAPKQLLDLYARPATESLGSLQDDLDDELLPEWLVDTVRGAPQGARNNILHWSLHRTVDERCFRRMLPILCQAARDAGLEPHEIVRTTQSVMKNRSEP